MEESWLDLLVPCVWFWITETRKKGTERPPTFDCPLYIISCHLHTSPLRWKLTSPFYWKASNNVHHGVEVKSHHTSVWHFLPRCNEISWLCQAWASSSRKFIQTPTEAKGAFWVFICPVAPSMRYRLLRTRYIFVDWMHACMNEWTNEQVSEWMKAELHYE